MLERVSHISLVTPLFWRVGLASVMPLYLQKKLWTRLKSKRRRMCLRTSRYVLVCCGLGRAVHCMQPWVYSWWCLCTLLQRKFDKKYGPTWHCIVGSDFKAFVSHESKHFIFFYIGKSAILLYKCG